ncbi:flagellar basal-body MS-ring/collar protein FliF [Jeotgalibaca caeni]|uniref:flagellar basal-body MS-ring/collar protein FliF n=1 Tax=Jeotgalibaca caeni TaxID=3028623 RepID=UPI00237ECCAE|nr:flagellar basal-body MS-ring/collar protein FliF [Jeotgalibaca caeni]MDE1548285.1 flagellar basal-body MS-ring/collar protein FliF [Jeotgalibaca caeni]
MEVVNNLINSIKSGWGSMSKGKKIGLSTIIVLFLVGGLSLSLFLNKVQYTMLFSQIEEEDAGNIVNDLEAQQIPYQLADGGTTIYIDENYVDKYRIELAVNDLLPNNSIGFEIFDNTSMMATDEDREVMRQRAIQGELERAIGSLSGVESVKVILSMPEKSIFTRPDETLPASASVMLRTINGHTLSTQAVEGIASLVSGAVDQLPKENISIIDQNGNVLSAFIQSDTGMQTADLASRNREMEQNYARELEQKLLKTLSPIYGANNLSISVNVKMDFSMEEIEDTVYGDAQLRSQDISASGGEIVGDGEAGLSGNDVAVSEIIEGETGNSASYHSTTNNEINTTITHTISETGEVTAITASILYNTGIPGMNEGDLQRVALSVLGPAEARTVEVHGANFSVPETGDFTDPVVAGNPLEAIWEQYGMVIVAGVGILLFAVVTGSIVQSLRRKKRMQLEEEEWEEEVSLDSAREEEKETKTLQDLLQNEKLQKEGSAMKHAKDNPELVADLIKMWMKDE